MKLRQVPTLSVEDMLIQYNVTTKRERWSNSKITNIFNISQNGLRREPKVHKHVLPLSHELGESMEALPSGPVAQIVCFPCSLKLTVQHDLVKHGDFVALLREVKL